MKKMLVLAALAAFTASPALAQAVNSQITDAVTKAATDAATKAATDQVNKAMGTESGGGNKANTDKVKNGPNYGHSMDHRQDGEHRKDKKKEKDRKKKDRD